MEQYTNNMSKRQIRHTLDSLLEGIQVIDFNWRYLYANTAVTEYYNTNKEEFRAQSMMDRYPGIETTEVFKVLQDCMVNRNSERLEIEFVYPDRKERWFDVSVVAVEEGICIMSLDITMHKVAEEKAEKATRLYAFISQVNQNIVRVKDEKALFSNSCRIAVELGKFEIAWIGLFNLKQKKINLIDQYGMANQELDQLKVASYLSKGPQEYVLQNNTYYICNDMENDDELIAWRPFAALHCLKSCLILPIRKSGEIIGTFNLYSSKINFSDKEEIALMMEMAGDISYALDMLEKAGKQERTEELLIKSEKRFRVLIEKSLDIKTLSKKDGKIFYASPSIKKILGYTQQEFIKLPFMTIFHPEDIPAFIKIRENLIQTPGKSIRQQSRLLHKNGTWIWCEGTMTNMLHEVGIEALVSSFNDVSEKKVTMLQREFDRNNLNALINNTTDLMWSIDTDFNLITSNKSFDEMMRFMTGEILAKGENTLSATFSDEERNRFKNFYERALLGEVFTETEYMDAPIDSWNEISLFPIMKNNEVIGTACYAHNITERKKAELVLEKQNKELLKTNFELDRFVYSVSHDLRAPLTAILGLISFIEEESQEADTLEHVQMIRARINRLDEFIKNILNYSRNNRMDLQVEKIDLQKTVESVISELCSMKDCDGIRFEIDIKETEAFFSDRQSITTLLENLISNAIKFNAKDKRDAYIKITGKIDMESMELGISDNGIGIAKEYHSKIFDMFYRLSSDVPGSGLGLYIVKCIIEKLGGTIMLESGSDSRTTFTIKLKNSKP
ncbi:MAG TPA: PAS domain S-box protein [Pedobacter sp.]|uniref:PAS domain S-box protein n=1 Tax=Pedobacter sp. TaxID=1411316 RepID=UPI002CC66D11|nr:PAS domain S-box protein [Pedobacter sp.]HMI02738.1 PAS domain S-box protein [Pedobacter sp.]